MSKASWALQTDKSVAVMSSFRCTWVNINVGSLQNCTKIEEKITLLLRLIWSSLSFFFNAILVLQKWLKCTCLYKNLSEAYTVSPLSRSCSDIVSLAALDPSSCVCNTVHVLAFHSW